VLSMLLVMESNRSKNSTRDLIFSCTKKIINYKEDIFIVK